MSANTPTAALKRTFRRFAFGPRHYLLALHGRGNFPGAKTRSRDLRQQQCRYLRPRLPLADRYGLSTTFGTFAGTQDFGSVEHTDVMIVLGPTDAHPVFASRMKKRLREGAKLIVIDPRRMIWYALQPALRESRRWCAW